MDVWRMFAHPGKFWQANWYSKAGTSLSKVVRGDWSDFPRTIDPVRLSAWHFLCIIAAAVEKGRPAPAISEARMKELKNNAVRRERRFSLPGAWKNKH